MTKMALFKNGRMVSRKFLLLLAVRYLKQEEKENLKYVSESTTH